MPFPNATYDPDADVLYIALRNGDQTRSIEIDDSHFIDVDEQGRVLGIEVLYPHLGINLDALAEHTGLAPTELARLTSVATSEPPIVPTVTAASSLVQIGYSIVPSIRQPQMPVVATTARSWATIKSAADPEHEFSLAS